MKDIYILRMTVLVLLLTSILSGTTWSQESVAPATLSGTEYLIAFPKSDFERTHQFMGLLITAESTTPVTVEIPIVPASDLEPITAFQVRSFTVRKGRDTLIEIPRTVEPRFNEEASLATVRVTSRAPVSVTVISARQSASGAYPAVPVSHWGRTYLPTALPAVSPSTTGVTSQLLITAVENGTRVTISPTAATTFRLAGEAFSINLNAKESYLIQARTQSAESDLSGTSISSTKPISVVAGHVRAALSGNPLEILPTPVHSAWHAMVQMPTEGNEWGKEYFSVPMRSNGDRFRLVALEASTTVHMTMYDASGNIAGERTIMLPSLGTAVDVYAPEGMSLNAPVHWKSDKPFSLAQLRLSAGENGNPDNSPAMVRLIPTSRYSARALFALPTSIRGQAFRPFDLQMVAIGTGNPFYNVTIDGVQATDLPNVSLRRINGNTWQMRASIATGSHSIAATNGVTFAGHVSGNNGSIGGVALAWELPNWSADIERDVIAPRITSQSESGTSIYIEVTDSTSQYFSGIESVEVHDSPGWDQDPFTPPLDPGENAAATFYVKNGVDPSGPLFILLRDYDGNTDIIKVTDGFCRQTAYTNAATERVDFTVSSSAAQEQKVRIDANMCGDEAHIDAVSFDPNGNANIHLENPTIDGGSLPHTILSNGYVEITVRTKTNLPKGTYSTNLDLVVDGKTLRVPVTLEVVTLGVADEKNGNGERLLNVAPNPAVGRVTLNLTEPLNAAGRVEITDASGRHIRSFDGGDVSGTRRIEWNGTEANGHPVPPGVYFVTLNDNGRKSTERVVLVR